MYSLSNILALKEEQFDCILCLSIFKNFDHFLGSDFIEDFLRYIKKRLIFKGILILDLSYWKVKEKTKINPDKIKSLLVENLSFIFLDKVGGKGLDQRELYIFLSY